MTTKEELGKKWKSISGAAKQKYAQITNKDIEQVEGDLDRLKELIQKKTGQTREQVEAFYEECCNSANGVMGQVSQATNEASKAVREGYNQVAEQAQHGYDQAVKTASQNPLSSIGIALGVGVLFGMIIGIPIGAERERELTWWDRWNRG